MKTSNFARTAEIRPGFFMATAYLASFAQWALAYVARLALDGVLPPQGFPFLTFFPAVMLAAYFFGLGPGLLCAALSVVSAYLSFFPREAQNWTRLENGDLIALIFFSSILLVDCVVLHLLRRSRTLAADRERDLRELTGNSPDVLTRFDGEYRHLFVSSAIERLTGKPVSHFIGKTYREVGMPSDLCDMWENALKSVFVDARPASLRFENGGVVFSATLVPEFDKERSSVKSVLGVTRDISEIDRHERALRAHDAQKDQMLATVAHELRNPIMTFAAGVAVLERLPEPSPILSRTISAMHRQTTQMSRLVRDLMDLNRIRANVIELELSVSDLTPILQSAIETSSELAQRKSVELELRLPDGVMALEADAARLIQVFSNLLTNAIKFSDEGETVSVEAKRHGDVYLVCVIDHGVGIESHLLEAVFEPFVQAPAGHKHQSGLGIGLALVKQILRLHNGDVTAASPGVGPGQGATFTVKLPAYLPS